MQESSSTSGVEPSTRVRPRLLWSGRGLEWLLVGVAALGAVLLFRARGSYGRGTELDVPITLVTSDREDLGCASSARFGRYRCEFRKGGDTWSDPPAPADRLAPYYSEDRRLYLIAGLFQQPALATRYAEEDPGQKPREALRRFSAHCKLRLVERTDGFDVRWLRTDTWHSENGPAWVAEPVQCTTR